MVTSALRWSSSLDDFRHLMMNALNFFVLDRQKIKGSVLEDKKKIFPIIDRAPLVTLLHFFLHQS